MSRLRIASFNANSIRSRLGIIIDWLAANDCDVLCVQETKATDDDFPAGAITDAGYHCVFKGQKSYNGVAIISRREADEVRVGLGDAALDVEARIIRARFGDVTVVNTYVPQGFAVDSPKFQYKLDWVRSLRRYFEADFTSDERIVWVGDFNVALEPVDVYDPEGLAGSVCFHPAEHEAFEYVRQWGFIDVFRCLHPGEAGHYTFWDYRIPNGVKRRMGWRLDHIWATAPMAEALIDCRIDAAPRSLEKPSDHTFILADFDVD